MLSSLLLATMMTVSPVDSVSNAQVAPESFEVKKDRRTVKIADKKPRVKIADKKPRVKI